MPFPVVPRLADYVTRLLGARGHGAGLTALDDLMPVMDIVDDSPDLAYLQGRRRFCMMATSPAGGAGVYSAVQLGFPQTYNGKDALIVVENAIASKVTIGTCYARTLNGSVSAPVAQFNCLLDGRLDVYGTTQGGLINVVLGENHALGAAPQVGPMFGASGVTTFPNLLIAPVVLVPPGVSTAAPLGSSLWVFNATVNEAIQVQFTGYIRGADEQELR